MFSWILDHYIATLSVSTLFVIGCGAVAWFFPPLRRLAVEAAVLVIGALAIFTRGYMTAKREDRERSEKAVKKAQEKFDEIERRPDTNSDLDKRLRDGKF
jgi:hypothetical protein